MATAVVNGIRMHYRLGSTAMPMPPGRLVSRPARRAPAQASGRRSSSNAVSGV